MATIHLSKAAYTAHVEEIRVRVERATRDWTGADWTHEHMLPCNACEHDTHTPCPACRMRYDKAGDAVMCDGTEDCQTCDDAANAAIGAADCGRHIMTALRHGDLVRAHEYAEEACELEAEFGDDPTWRPVKDAVESLIAADDAAGAEIDEEE